ncbi:MAG: prepilin-type N-terminal cleavage/methylation domain-containing protein [Syntrophaceae bacterium]|nr:prepilin-type N-terminal cleavage/methylation domain-containing protein [Syntrophaceae bacterium]
MKRPRGFTLLEVLIAVLILGIVMTTVYASYWGTFRVIGETRSDAEAYGIGRTVLDRVTKDLAATSPWAGAFFFQTRVQTLGREEVVRLRFRSRAHLAFREDEAPEGIALIEYRLAEETGKAGYVLWRSDSLFLDPGSGWPETPRGGFLLGERIEALTWRFYDERGREYDRWDSEGGLETQQSKAPVTVVVELRLLNEAGRGRPYRFTTRIRLPLAQPEGF